MTLTMISKQVIVVFLSQLMLLRESAKGILSEAEQGTKYLIGKLFSFSQPRIINK